MTASDAHKLGKSHNLPTSLLLLASWTFLGCFTPKAGLAQDQGRNPSAYEDFDDLDTRRFSIAEVPGKTRSNYVRFSAGKSLLALRQKCRLAAGSLDVRKRPVL